MYFLFGEECEVYLSLFLRSMRVFGEWKPMIFIAFAFQFEYKIGIFH